MPAATGTVPYTRQDLPGLLWICDKLLAVDVASMTKADNNHQQDIILDRVNDLIIANMDPKSRTAMQGNGLGRPRIGSKECDGAVDTIAVVRLELFEGPKGRWT